MSLELELLELAADGDEAELEARCSELTKSQYIRVMKSVQKLEDAMIESAEKWENACYWGRGVEWPGEA